MTKLDILTYQPTPQDKFFFDNNIWMYLFCPHNGTNQKKFVDGYSSFLGKVLDANSKVLVSSLILAEFYNAYIQIDYRLVKRGNEDFKYKRDYRPSNRFHETHQTIMNTIESQILGIADRIDDNFSKIGMENLREGSEKMDFNDSYYLQKSRPDINSYVAIL